MATDIEYRKMTEQEAASRRKRNVAIGISLFVLAMLFMVTAMVRVSIHMGGQ